MRIKPVLSLIVQMASNDLVHANMDQSHALGYMAAVDLGSAWPAESLMREATSQSIKSDPHCRQCSSNRQNSVAIIIWHSSVIALYNTVK